MISVVIPVYNEQESLAALHAEIAAVARDAGLDLEVVFIDDGSEDGSWEEILRLAQEDSRVRGIRLRTNFGKADALSAGTRAARGDIIVTLDADLQDDPREIPRLLEALEHGPDLSHPKRPVGRLDVVSGWKRVRHDPWHKVGPSRVFNWMVGRLTGVKLHDHNCGMKAYRSGVFREVRLYGELHRFIPVLAAARGFRIGEVVVNHRPRKFGRSKYGVRRIVRGFLDLLTVKFLTDFEHRPQHLLGGLGLLAFTLGIAGMVYLAVAWVGANWLRVWDYTPLYQRPLLIYSVAALLLGAQMMSIGLLAELITAYARPPEQRYSIAERVGGERPPETPAPAAPHELPHPLPDRTDLPHR